MSAIERIVWLLLGFALCMSRVHADAVVTVCGKDVWPGDPRVDFSEAVQIGGRITFACSGIINLTQQHPLFKDVQIDGEGKITLDGQGHRMFGLGSSGSHVAFTRLRLEGAATQPGSIPGSVIAGEGFVSFLDGVSLRRSERPVWLLAGDLDVRNATIAENTGPVLIVSEGVLTIAGGARFADNKGELLATGPSTKVRIDNAQFWRNGHSKFGGVQPGGCDVSIKHAWFADNTAAEDGGAILSTCNLTLEDSQFERNHAGRDGGAVYLTQGANASLRKLLFRANQAGRNGGAIAAFWNPQQRGALRIRHSRFEQNSASSAGGALVAGESSLIEIGAGAFIGNSAGTGGGALYARQSPLFAHGSLFRKNHARSGAAIQTLCMPQMGRIANSLIVDNAADTSGGAYYGGNMYFLNTTVTGNGGASIQHGELCGAPSVIQFTNTILDGGWSAACGGADAQRTFKDLGHNLQFPWHACGASIPVSLPLLGPFYAPLRPLSPAGSAGNNAACAAPPINGRDFFGTHRPQGDACSIGAVEGDLSTLIERALKRRRPDQPATG